jgi:hypothetical protein
MTVETWFWHWLERHWDRHPRGDWPRADDSPAFYAGWLKLFIVHGVTEAAADEASEGLMADPPRFHGDHPRATLDAARAVLKREASHGRGPAVDSREAALAASRECEDCHGQGLTVRYRQRSADPTGRVRAGLVCYCRCPMGRWVEKQHREKVPETRKRIYDLADNLWLEAEEYQRAPERPAVEAVDGPLAKPLRQLPYVLPSPTIVRGEHGGLMCLVFLDPPVVVPERGRGDEGCEDVPEF